jgi:hypothetical protein
MEKIPAIAGWNWVRQGFGLFRQQPGEMSTLFILYFFLMVALSFLPILGLVLQQILTPVFSMAFMQACADIASGKRVHPKLLFAGFRQPSFRPLALLGSLYLAAALLAFLVADLASSGGFWQALNSPVALDEKAWGDLNLMGPLLAGLLVYKSISVLLWFAAPLIAWQGMSVGKSLFFSFFTIVRTWRAFFIYLCAWIAIFMGVSSIASSVLLLIFGEVQSLMLLPFAILLMVIAQCSVYPSYALIFGAPEQPPPESA